MTTTMTDVVLRPDQCAALLDLICEREARRIHGDLTPVYMTFSALDALNALREGAELVRRGTRDGRPSAQPSREGRPSTPRRQPSQVTP